MVEKNILITFLYIKIDISKTCKEFWCPGLIFQTLHHLLLRTLLLLKSEIQDLCKIVCQIAIDLLNI